VNLCNGFNIEAVDEAKANDARRERIIPFEFPDRIEQRREVVGVFIGNRIYTFVAQTEGHDAAASFLSASGTDRKNNPGADVDTDGIVGSADLGLLLSAWGPCPE
jgi:hypothetical protein